MFEAQLVLHCGVSPMLAPICFSQLMAKLFMAIDNRGACDITVAENPNDGTPCDNAWVQVFDDTFGEGGFAANEYKIPTAAKKVSNFKDKVVNKYWPLLYTYTKDKGDQELTPTERMGLHHYRLYQQAQSKAIAKSQNKAARQRNYNKIEQSMGLAPSRGGVTPNTSLNLEVTQPKGSGMSSSGAGSGGGTAETPSDAATRRRGLGGYLAPGGGPSSFDHIMATAAKAFFGDSMFPTESNGLAVASVTPAATEPPAKKAKVSRRFKFIRGEHFTEFIASGDDAKNIQSLKHVCSDKEEDYVFLFDDNDLAALRDKRKILKVNIGGECELQYKEVKSIDLDTLLDMLSPSAQSMNPITFEIKLVETRRCAKAGLKTYESD